MAIPIRSISGMVLLVLAFGAFAQTNSTDEQSQDEAAKVLQPITVTGYHIKRMELEGPAPVIVFDRMELERAGINTLEEFARNLPLNWGPFGDSWGMVRDRPVGQVNFDLRGIGADSTLTLVNGRRIAPYAGFWDAIIDVNAIPVSAIDRIEILKDGASAQPCRDATRPRRGCRYLATCFTARPKPRTTRRRPPFMARR